MAQTVEITIPSHPRWLRLVRALVEQCCREFEIEDVASRQVVSAADEVLSNVMRHAYAGDTDRPIRLRCSCDGAVFEIEVCDHGEEFDPFSQSVPPPDELRAGGRGIFLILSSMDDCEYAREDGWNCVRLRKRLAQAADAA